MEVIPSPPLPSQAQDLIHRLNLSGHLFHGKLLHHHLPPPAPQSPAKIRVRHQPAHGLGQGPEFPGGHQKAGFRIEDHLRNAAHVVPTTGRAMARAWSRDWGTPSLA